MTTPIAPAGGLVTRLRAEGADAMREHLSLGMAKLCSDAADEIERLRSYLGSGGENKLAVEFAQARREAETQRAAKEGVEALLCDAQKEIADLRNAHETMEKEIEQLKTALQDCIPLAAALASTYMLDHKLKDYAPHHKEIINRAQRLLGGRELP